MDVLSRLSELRERGEPVALATVVAARRPASARPGDRALVLPSGEMVGWIGGSCAQPTVQREGLRALADGQPRLVRLSPEVGLLPPQEGVVEDVMTCHSGGTLEIYVEPFLPAPWLLVTGDSPIAEALATLAALDDFRVRRELPEGEPHPLPLPTAVERGEAHDSQLVPPLHRNGEGGRGWGLPYVVIAGQTGEDEQQLEQALALDPGYVAFVGSRKRLGEVTARLRERGVAADLLARVKGPAGLDIGAVTAFEIALSIMAEIVQHRRRGRPSPPDPEAVDPVCGMRVAIPGARHVVQQAGQDYYFCCPSCRRLFEASPEQYLSAATPAPAEGESSDAIPG